MVTLLLDSAQLEVSLSGTERALSFHRDAIRIDRTHINKVQLTDDLWTWIRGTRTSGTSIPGAVAAGVWTSTAGDDFLMVRGRKPGVVIDLVDDSQYARLLLTTRHGLALAQALNIELSEDELAEFGDAKSTKPTPKRGRRTATA